MVFIFYSEGGIRKAALRNMPVACFNRRGFSAEKGSHPLRHVVANYAGSRRLFYAAHEKVISHLLRRVSSQNRDRWRWVTILFFDLAAGQPWSPFQVNLLKSLAKGHSSW